MARGSPTASDDARALARLLSLAHRYVRSGVRSTRDVTDYLNRRGVSPETAAHVVADYQARGELDDLACAKLWAEHWSRSGYAWAAIQMRLEAKGLHEHTIQHVRGPLGTPSADEARARTLATRLLSRRLARQPRARLARLLAAHGFDAELIERLLSELTVSISTD